MKIIPCQNVDKSEGMKISTVFNNLNTDTIDTIDTEKNDCNNNYCSNSLQKFKRTLS